MKQTVASLIFLFAGFMMWTMIAPAIILPLYLLSGICLIWAIGIIFYSGRHHHWN
jgi:hypothetical protein